MAPTLPPRPATMPPVITSQPPTRIPPVDPKWHVAKIAIRSFSLLFAIIAVILAAVIAVREPLLEDNWGIYFGVYICALPSCVVVILWDLAEFITLCARRSSTGRGIHPGAHVGLDLVLWLQLCILWGILTPVVEYGFDYDWDYDTQSYIVAKSDLTARNICVAIVTFMIILSILHFFLFVRACIETHQRNRMKNQPIYIIQGPAPGISQHPYGQIPGNMNGMQFYYAPPMQQQKPSRPAPAPMMTPAVPRPAPTRAPSSAPSPVPQIPPIEGYYAPSPTRGMEAMNVRKSTTPAPLAQETAVASSSGSSDVEQPRVSAPTSEPPQVPAPTSEPPKIPAPEFEPPAVAGPSNSTQ